MASKNPQNPSLNLADILRNLATLAPQNQDQSRSQTPDYNKTVLQSGAADYSNSQLSTNQYRAAPQQQQQPCQHPNQPWQPPDQTGWQPPLQQQAWQPSAQIMSQQSPSSQQQYEPPSANPHFQQYQRSATYERQPQMCQPMPDPRLVQMQQMSDPHHLQRMKEKEMQRQRGVDPATIIDWPTGLKCVMKTVAMNEKIISEIRKLIQIQNSHETQWYAGRRAIIMHSADRAAERRRNQKKVDDMLKSLGTTPSSATQSILPTPEQETEALNTELEVFDAKVYRAQHEMVKEMTGKLRALGVPFFGTRSGLVVLRSRSRIKSREGSAVEEEKGSSLADKKDIEKKERDEASAQGKINEIELVELQRKMLGILQDLCEEK